MFTLHYNTVVNICPSLFAKITDAVNPRFTNAYFRHLISIAEMCVYFTKYWHTVFCTYHRNQQTKFSILNQWGRLFKCFIYILKYTYVCLFRLKLFLPLSTKSRTKCLCAVHSTQLYMNKSFVDKVIKSETYLICRTVKRKWNTV